MLQEWPGCAGQCMRNTISACCIKHSVTDPSCRLYVSPASDSRCLCCRTWLFFFFSLFPDHHECYTQHLNNNLNELQLNSALYRHAQKLEKKKKKKKCSLHDCLNQGEPCCHWWQPPGWQAFPLWGHWWDSEEENGGRLVGITLWFVKCTNAGK